jgi:hypothetical protein
MLPDFIGSNLRILPWLLRWRSASGVIYAPDFVLVAAARPDHCRG